jgi:hypothetical protein
MADITASQAAFNSGVVLTLNDATASQTVNIDNVADERTVLVVENTNTEDGQTATIQVLAGDFGSSVLGTLSVDVAKGASAVIGPLEGARFKNSASKLTVNTAVTASGTVSSVKLVVIKLP